MQLRFAIRANFFRRIQALASIGLERVSQRRGARWSCLSLLSSLLLLTISLFLNGCASSTLEQYGCPRLPKRAEQLGRVVIVGEIHDQLYSFSSPSAHPPWSATIFDVKLKSTVRSSIGTFPSSLKVVNRSYYDPTSRELYQPTLTDDGFIGAPVLEANTTSLMVLNKVSEDLRVVTDDADYEVVHAELCHVPMSNQSG